MIVPLTKHHLFDIFSLDAVVPYNQPVAAMDLLNRFLRNETFLDVAAPTIRFGEGGVSNALDMANPKDPITKQDHRMSTPVIVSLAFIAGILLTIITNKFLATRQENRGGYSRIPEAKDGNNGFDFETATSTPESS